MTSLLQRLEKNVAAWARKNCPKVKPPQGFVEPCRDARHGHFQTNLAMQAAKELKQNPREIAQKIVDHCARDSWLEPPQIAGPGFVNFTFKKEGILEALKELTADSHLGIPQVEKRETVVVDFSSPNVAKAMHIGHIRSTILGDSLARTLKSLGHRVITDNHLGDWGTQFGKIILGYKRAGKPPLDPQTAIEQMEKLYQETHQACEADEKLLEEARQELQKLQFGDEENNQLWKLFRDDSQKEFDAIYQRLGVHFDHTYGESFYHLHLKDVVGELHARGIAEESEGALVVFFPDNEELKDKPFLIQKSDGAFLYSTTDLATVQFRAREFRPDTIIYVTDGRQQLHFQQLFAAVNKWKRSHIDEKGEISFENIRFEHVWFGSILGKNKKPLKTREGTPIKLKELLDEAESRAAAILKEKRPDLAPEKAAELARVIGLGAVKYADLAQNRNLDYVFDWDKLLAFDGNTAPYLINAYVRTRSILRKAEEGRGVDETDNLTAEHDLEFELIRKLIDFGDVIALTAAELRPHHLCGYLYELAALFHRFFENCPVLKAASPQLKASRLLLCTLTGNILRRGLHLLGIQTVEEM